MCSFRVTAWADWLEFWFKHQTIILESNQKRIAPVLLANFKRLRLATLMSYRPQSKTPYPVVFLRNLNFEVKMLQLFKNSRKHTSLRFLLKQKIRLSTGLLFQRATRKDARMQIWIVFINNPDCCLILCPGACPCMQIYSPKPQCMGMKMLFLQIHNRKATRVLSHLSTS